MTVTLIALGTAGSERSLFTRC